MSHSHPLRRGCAHFSHSLHASRPPLSPRRSRHSEESAAADDEESRFCFHKKLSKRFCVPQVSAGRSFQNRGPWPAPKHSRARSGRFLLLARSHSLHTEALLFTIPTTFSANSMLARSSRNQFAEHCQSCPDRNCIHSRHKLPRRRQ